MVNIKKFRKEKGLSQVELAEMLGFGQHAVSTWENGRREPDIATLKKLATIFECSLDELVDYNQEKITKEQKELFSDIEKLDETQFKLLKEFVQNLIN